MKPSWTKLVAAAILLSLTFLTRYAGVAFIAMGLAGVFLLMNSSLRARISASTRLALVSGVPAILWIARNQIITGSGADRSVSFHSINPNQFREALATISSWFLIPENTSGAIKLIPILIFSLMAAVWGFDQLRQAQNGPGSILSRTVRSLPPLMWLCIFMIICYGGILIVTITMLTTYTPLDYRILSPIYFPFLFLTLYLIGYFLSKGSFRPGIQFALPVVMLLFLGLSFRAGFGYLIQAASGGLGYNSSVWYRSETLQFVRDLPQGAVLYSNAPEAIYLHTGKAANKIPQTQRLIDSKPNENYQQDLEQIRSEMQSGNPVTVVYFDLPQRQMDDSLQTMISQLSLDLKFQASDGRIYIARLAP